MIRYKGFIWRLTSEKKYIYICFNFEVLLKCMCIYIILDHINCIKYLFTNLKKFEVFDDNFLLL